MSYLLPIYFWNFCWQKLITVIYIVDIRRPVMISIYIFLKHAKNVVSSVPWNSLHSSGLYFHEIQPNFSKSKIYSLFTQKRNYILSWGENTIYYVFESKNERGTKMLFLQKRLGLSYVLYLFAKKYFPRTFQEMSSFLIITQKDDIFPAFFLQN